METSTAPNFHFVERRRYGRLPSHFDVDCVLYSGDRVGDQITGKAINISKEGVGVVLRSDVTPGTRVEMTIFSKEEQSVGTGEVIWRKEVKGRTVHGIKISHWSYLDPFIEREFSQRGNLPLG